MSYERNFYNQYSQLSNPNSQYYQKAYSNLRNTLNASSPTTNSLLGIQMAMGGSYKGSLVGANKQRRGIETRNSETAQQGINQLYVNSQGQAMNALQGAQSAYEYEDSQPGFWDYVAGPLATVAGNMIAPGIGGILGGAIGGGLSGGLSGGSQNPTSPNISQGGLGGMDKSNYLFNGGQLSARSPSGSLNTPPDWYSPTTNYGRF